MHHFVAKSWSMLDTEFESDATSTFWECYKQINVQYNWIDLQGPRGLLGSNTEAIRTLELKEDRTTESILVGSAGILCVLRPGRVLKHHWQDKQCHFPTCGIRIRNTTLECRIILKEVISLLVERWIPKTLKLVHDL